VINSEFLTFNKLSLYGFFSDPAAAAAAADGSRHKLDGILSFELMNATEKLLASVLIFILLL